MEEFMKKKILIGVAIVIAIIAITLGFLVNKANNMKSEFTGFREELDKDFFPLLKDTHKHFETVIQKGQSHELENWYLLDEDGMTSNLKYSREIDKIRDRIVNTDVKQKDTIELKKNVLNSLSTMDSALKSINTLYKNDSSDVLWATLGLDIDKLKDNVDKQNKILGKYYK